MINSSETDLSDFSMLDLFRSEMESHSATLNEGLLALESGSGSSEGIEALMRAAHSIKGGARIVELDEAVKLAHTMEDCFVATQKGKISLQSDHIDILLKGVDMLNRIAAAAGEDGDKWMASNRREIDSLIESIAAITKGMAVKKTEPQPSSDQVQLKKTSPYPVLEKGSEEVELGLYTSSTEKENDEKQTHPPLSLEKRGGQGGEFLIPHSQEPEPKDKAESEPQPPPLGGRGIGQETSGDISQRHVEKDRMVRVTASKIDRLMALGGEVVVSTRWLPSFYESLLIMKKTQLEVFNILERLTDMLEEEIEENNKRESIDIRKLATRAREKSRDCNYQFIERVNRLEMFTSASENLSDRLYHELIGIRMRPFADGIRNLPRMVRDMARRLGKKVRLIIVGENTEVDRDILEKLDAPLIHLLRNALDHGIEYPEERVAIKKSETGNLRLEAAHRSGMLMITVSDDGRGVEPLELRRRILSKGLATAEMTDKMTDAELMEFLFLPGFSTLDHITEISGRGVGLDVVHNMVHEVGGLVRAVSKPGHGVTFHMELPLTLSVIQTFIVEIASQSYAFPLARIDRCLNLSKKDIETVEDRQYFRFDEKNIALVDIHDVLEVEKPQQEGDYLEVVVISDRMHAYGLVVDKFLGESDLVVRPLDHRLGRVSDIGAVAIMLDGSPVLIFDIEDLVRSIDGMLSGNRLQKVGYPDEDQPLKTHKHILVVDDSITVREMERKLLESKGYLVDVAVDGIDAWNLLRTSTYDMVISDIDMPRMNGFELIMQMKQHEKFKSLPVMIVSYKNKEEDRLRGLEAGASYYLTKSSFQDNSFIDAVIDLIGEN